MPFTKLRNLFLSCLLVALAACSPAEQEDTSTTEIAEVAEAITLEGSNWQLVKLTVLGGYVFTPDEPGKYVLNFRSENRLTGTSDCNSITGSWHQDGARLNFEPFSTSRSLCPPGSLHNNLILNLRDVTAQSMRDGHLVLTTNTDGIEIEFESRD